MATSIQVSEELLERLKSIKLFDKETYEDIIWDLLEDSMELSAETKKRIVQSEKEIQQGKTISLEKLKKKMSV